MTFNIGETVYCRFTGEAFTVVSYFGGVVGLSDGSCRPRGELTPPKAEMFRANRCATCDAPTDNPENDYCEFICDSCEQNSEERAWEIHCQSFYGGGDSSLRQQQIEALKLK